MKIVFTLLLFLLYISVSKAQNNGEGKPAIWIHTDITGALGYEVNGNKAEAITDANSDPDDQVAMAMYLMMANRFDTKAIVLASTTRNTQFNTLNKFNQTIGQAYETGLPCLNKVYGDYPSLADMNIMESSLTSGTGHLSFSNSPAGKYDSYASLPKTVKDLVDELGKDIYSKNNPLYVLVWGPMTEVAMAVKHLVRNNKKSELERLHVVSHWTTSYSNQQSNNGCYNGNEAVIYGVANCNQNCAACKYVRDQSSKSDADFLFTDVASVGQTGVVNGSASFFNGGNGGVGGTEYKAFQKSAIGDIFVKSKFGFGKPDGSDCASFLTVLGEYGVTLADYNNNGLTTAQQETNAKNIFKSTAKGLMAELLEISDVAAGINCTVDPEPCTISVSSTSTNQDCELKGSVILNALNYGARSNIKYKVGSGAYSENVATTNSYTLSDLSAGTYQIYAMWGNGDCPDTEVGSVTITNTCDPGPDCSFDLDIHTSAHTCEDPGIATLSLKNYGTRTNVQYKLNGGAYTGNIGTGQPYTFGELEAGIYMVYAQWGNGDCADIEAGSFEIARACDPIPADIDDLVPSSPNCYTVVLNWTDVDNEDGYRIRRKLATENTYTNLYDVPAGTETFSDESVEEDTEYEYMVRPLQEGKAVAISNTPLIKTSGCVITGSFGKASAGAIKGKLHPNPMKDWLKVSFAHQQELKKVTLQSLSGKFVDFDLKSIGKQEIELKNIQAPQGTYILTIVTDQGVAIEQVVVY